MAHCQEVLYISDACGTIQSVDPRIGTVIVTHRGLSVGQNNCLSLIGDDYVIAAEASKPILTVWPLNSQEPIPGPKLVLPGKTTALSVSSDGNHTVLAIDSKIYVYQNCTGALLGVLSKHYLGVTKLLFLDDCVHFVSCAEDGAVLVWSLATVMPGQRSVAEELSGIEPVCSFSAHSLAVTDMYCGAGGIKGRLYTCSLDQTVKLYSLRSGSLLLSIAFEESILSLRPNCIETSIYLGTTGGKILEYNLDPLPRSLQYQPNDSDMKKPLEGHKSSVKCLSTSLDGQILVSGSEDGKVIVWDIPSRQLLRLFTMKGPVCAIILTLSVANLFTDNFQPRIPFQNFRRVRDEDDGFCVAVRTDDNLSPIDYNPVVVEKTVDRWSETAQPAPATEDIDELKRQLESLKKKNKGIYQFTVKQILRKGAK